TDAGIAEAVRNPLRLACHADVSEQDALIASIRRDVTDRAGDLALVQMALYAMWQKHRADHVNLLVAYSQLGGVAGALAHEAEHLRTQRLDAAERALLGAIFVRLVRLGETGGATRRTADLADFEGPRRALIARLAHVFAAPTRSCMREHLRIHPDELPRNDCTHPRLEKPHGLKITAGPRSQASSRKK